MKGLDEMTPKEKRLLKDSDIQMLEAKLLVQMWGSPYGKSALEHINNARALLQTAIYGVAQQRKETTP